jgi:hypothetical protein
MHHLMEGLYALDPPTAPFTKACGGYTGEDGEACALLAPLAGGAGFALRDSKWPEGGELRFTGGELRALAAHIADRL